MAADGLICDGDHLVLDVNGEKLSFVQKLKANGKIRVGKYMVPAAPLIGAPYGALFEVTNDGKALQRVLLPPSDEITRITETEKNNSGLFDRNSENQKLTQDEIEELKKSGKAGAEIIQALCSNSATFQNKTEFSQDKYKKRKAKKYLTYLTVRKPNARILCEAYYDKGPERVAHLRHDSLAVLMSFANVAAGAKVLVAEQCGGVLTAAAVERLGGVGAVCALQLDERPAPLDAVRQMNLSVAQRAALFTAPAGSLLRDKEAADKGQLYDSRGNTASGAKPEQQAQPKAQQVTKDQPGEGEPAATSGEAAAPSAAAEGTSEGAMDVDAAAPPVRAATEDDGSAVAADKQDPSAADGEKDTAAAAAMTEGAGDAMVVEAAVADANGEAMVVEAAAVSEAAGTAMVAEVSATEGGAAKEEKKIQHQPEQRSEQQQPRREGGGYGSFLPRPEVLRAVLTSGFDSCLVAIPRVHPTAALAALWPLLAPSATFAVFSPWPQPLAETLSHLQISRNAVLLQLQESWLRPYQVLPARTHPHMSCSGTGGYILSGIKVIPPDATPLEQQLQFLSSQPPPQQQLQGPAAAAASPAAARAGQPGDEAEAAGAAAADAENQGQQDAAGEEGAAQDKADGTEAAGGRGDDGGWGGRGRGRGWGGDGNDGNNWRGRGRWNNDGGGGGGRGRWNNDGGGGRGRWNSDGGGGFRGGGGRWGRGGRDFGGKRKPEGGGGDYAGGGKRQAK